MADITNPHDKFFEEMLTQPEAARIFLRDFLPPAVAMQFDLSRLQLVKDSFGAWMGYGLRQRNCLWPVVYYAPARTCAAWISGDKGPGKDHRSKGRTRAC